MCEWLKITNTKRNGAAAKFAQQIQRAANPLLITAATRQKSPTAASQAAKAPIALPVASKRL